MASYGKNHLQNLKGPMELAPGLLTFRHRASSI